MGETIGHYRVLEVIGSGGIGEVYKARDTKQGRTVAIKEASRSIVGDAERRAAFLADARAAARLTHPNVAALYEIVEEPDDLFLVFDFATGESLKALVGGRPLNPRRAVDLAVQIADALADAHAEGLVHGDLKPENIIVTPRGNARILDFGFARWTRGGAIRAAAAQLSSSLEPAALSSTIAYLSPEQAVGEQGDARTDVFSLGVILFEMLTGKLPFGGATVDAMVLQIARAQPPSIRTLNPSLPAEIDAIVARALSKSVTNRYESAAALSAELRGLAAILDVRATVAAEHASSVRGPRRRRRSGGLWILAAIAIALVAVLAWWLFRFA